MIKTLDNVEDNNLNAKLDTFSIKVINLQVFFSKTLKFLYMIIHKLLDFGDIANPIINSIIVIYGIILMCLLGKNFISVDGATSALYGFADSIENIIILIFIYELLLLMLLFFKVISKTID